jgi:uncharacterized protein (DUF58 family)
MAGDYQSAFRGSGIEFEEVREYTPGDEVKSIDWNVTARTGRAYVKTYREERELILWLLVDMSASGAFGTAAAGKREVMAETAAILAFNAIRNNDKVGALLFTDRVERHLPPGKGPAHVWRVIHEILGWQPVGTGTDLSEVLRFHGKVARRRSVSFLISDFLADGYQRDLSMAARKHDLIGVRVSDPGEFTLPAAGLIPVVDLESGVERVLDASDPATREAFASIRGRQHRDTAETLRRCGVDTIEVRTDGSLADPLLKYFRTRERRRLR